MRYIDLLVILSIVVMPCFPLMGFSQTPAEDESATFTLEKVSEATESDPDYQEAAEYLDSRSIPVKDLARATPGQLQRIPVLSREQSKALADYIAAYGPPLTVYELQVIPGFDSTILRKLLPYVRVGPPVAGPPVTLQNLVKLGYQELTLRYQQVLQRKEGYRNGDYSGSPQKYLFRYGYRFSDRIRISLAGEKDAGEQFCGPAQPSGMDFYAGFLSYTGHGLLQSVIIGNLTAGFGQGLVLGGGSRLGSVPGFSSPLRTSQGIRGSMAMNETGYLRGIGITMTPGRFTISAFGTRQLRDGTLTVTDTFPDGGNAVSSIGGTGYHRTEPEITKKGVVKETVLGGNVSYTGDFFRIGVTGMKASWSLPLSPSPEPYRQFSLHGTSSAAAGLNLIFRLRSFSVFAELSRSFPGGMAVVAGIQTEGIQDADLSLTVRSYARDYCNPYAAAIGQNSCCGNERGIFLTGTFRPFRPISLSAFADLFAFPWLKYRVDAPSQGAEAGALLTWTLSSALVLAGRYSWSRGETNLASSDQLHVLETSTSQTLRVTLTWAVSDNVTMKSLLVRKGACSGTVPSGFGVVLGQDLMVRLLKGKTGVAFSYCLFDIPAYDLRIYIREPDVLYALSVPAYQGRGIRVVTRLGLSLTRMLDLWGWLSSTWYDDRSVVGTGSEMIMGNQVTEVKVQVRVRL